MPRPPPTSCENIECDEGMECRVRERDGLKPVVRCKPIRVVPSPRDCSELECSDGFVCMVTNGTAICVEPPPLPDACEGLNCEEQNLECRTFTFLNITRAICGPISDCNRLMCNESEGLECRVGGEGLSRFAFCARTANCSRIHCNETQGLECRVVGEGVVPVAVCLVTRNCSILNPVCRRSGLLCEEPQSDGDFDSASCVVPSSCEDLECNPGMVCREFIFNNGDASGSGSASGSPSSTSGPVTATSRTPQTVARCVPELPSSCVELECEEEQVCISQGIPSRNFSFASCLTQNFLSALTPPSCTNTGLNQCSQFGQLCVDLVQGGNQVSFSCVQTNCMEGDLQGSGNVCSTPGTSCISVPRSLSGRGIDSVCLQSVLQFEFGTICENRAHTCQGELACQETEIDGDVVGTICTSPAPVVGTICDSIECADEEECYQYKAEGSPFLALCQSSASIDTILEAILPQLPSGNP